MKFKLEFLVAILAILACRVNNVYFNRKCQSTRR
jgi:hypothetical protein